MAQFQRKVQISNTTKNRKASATDGGPYAVWQRIDESVRLDSYIHTLHLSDIVKVDSILTQKVSTWRVTLGYTPD
jgi:hypothetical protein